MYFASRMQAGRMLAAQLSKKYHNEKCAVIALNDGGVMVGAQIASELHCVLTLLQVGNITLPREPEAIAGISEDGSVSYNPSFSAGEVEELMAEYYQYIEQEKLTQLHELRHASGSGGLINRKLLKGRSIILVSDGFSNGFGLVVAAQYLKPVSYKKLIVATPLSSVEAVDKMHVLADEIYCLSVIEDYISTDHYYDQQDVPDHPTVVRTIETIISNWK